MPTSHPGRHPRCATYLGCEGLDLRPGRERLQDAGWSVTEADDLRDLERSGPSLENLTALLVGYSQIDETLLDRLPNLRVIATLSAGVDMVDVVAASARGVQVANVPDAATEEVAIHTLALTLGCLRGFSAYRDDIARGGWNLEVPGPLRRPSGLTLGLFGLGRIGRRFADLAAPIFGDIVAHDPHLPGERWPSSVTSVSAAEVLARSDVVSLHLPASPGGHPLIDASTIRQMRRGSVLVNVSRGALVDLDAVLAALDRGVLAAAGLDVLLDEPPHTNHPIRHHPQALVTPHAAFLSTSSALAYVETQADNVIAWGRDGQALHPINLKEAAT